MEPTDEEDPSAPLEVTIELSTFFAQSAGGRGSSQETET